MSHCNTVVVFFYNNMMFSYVLSLKMDKTDIMLLYTGCNNVEIKSYGNLQQLQAQMGPIAFLNGAAEGIKLSCMTTWIQLT